MILSMKSEGRDARPDLASCALAVPRMMVCLLVSIVCMEQVSGAWDARVMGQN